MEVWGTKRGCGEIDRVSAVSCYFLILKVLVCFDRWVDLIDESIIGLIFGMLMFFGLL